MTASDHTIRDTSIRATLRRGALSSGAVEFWDAVERLVESRLDRLPGLVAHGLAPLAAGALERRGSPAPGVLQQQQHLSRIANLTAPLLLERVRAACDGPLLLHKGAEAAARYPDRARGFGDIDLLVPDAERVQRQLLAAGFLAEPDPHGAWVGIHHLARLTWPGTSLAVEIHSAPKWPDGSQPPANDELFHEAVESETGVAGVLAPASRHHALLVAAHAWAHQPLGKARDLVDFGALRSECDDAELELLARAWGLDHIRRATSAALDALLTGGKTWPLRLWAKHVPDLSEQTVFQQHLQRLLAPFWAHTPTVAIRRSFSALAATVRPADDEEWREKLARAAAALRRASTPLTEHHRKLRDSAARRRRGGSPDDADPGGRSYPKG